MMTRFEIGNILSATMQTRTVKPPMYDNYGDVQDNWTVILLHLDSNNILNITCTPPDVSSSVTIW